MSNFKKTFNNYKRPETTFQDTLSKEDIKEQLKDYKKVDNITSVSIGTHLRYFTINPKTGEKAFRLGGTLNKIDPEGRFVILDNGRGTRWSVQIKSAIFFSKLREEEIKNELRNELKHEIMTEMEVNPDVSKENKMLKKQLKSMEEKYKLLEKEYSQVHAQLKMIEKEIKKEKERKNK